MLRARDARPEDYAEACRFWTAFRADQPAPPEADWNARYRESTLLLVDDSGGVAGYAVCIPYGARGDIRHIMIAPELRGRGIGRQLMEAVRERLRGAGCTDWRLEVRADNAAGVALYRKVGMEVLHVLITLRMPRTVAEHLGASKSGTLAVEAVDPVDDAVLEARFDLGRGQLARCRTVPASGVWRIGEDALAHYRAQLAPGLSLFFPFRAATRDHTAHLMAAAVERGMEPELEMLVVGDEAAAPITTAGASATERSLEMGGLI